MHLNKTWRALSRNLVILILVIIVIIAAVGGYLALHKSSKETTLNVITFSGQSADFIQYAANQFVSSHPGVKINVIQEPFSEYISDEETSLAGHSTQYAILGYTSTSAQDISKYLLPLNSSDFNMSDIISPQEDFGGIIYNVSSHSYETIGIAYETAIYLTAYNIKIFDNSTLASEFSSQYHMNFSPTTWKNWTVVEDVDNFLTSKGITKYGFLIDDHENHGIIDAYPAIFGYYYRDAYSLNHGNYSGIPGFNIMFEGYTLPGLNYPLPSFNSSEGVQALETYKTLVSYEVSPSSEQIQYGNLPTIYSSGEAPGAFLFITQLSSISSNVSSETYLAPLPGGYAETGTDFLGINKYLPASEQKIALEFLEFLVSPKVQEEAFIKFGKFPVSREAFMQLMSNTSLNTQQLEWLKEVYKASSNAFANPPNIPVTYSSLIPDFNDQVFNYLTSTSVSPSSVLQEAANEWIASLQSYYS
ncbi:ABC transporter substrate-binding protein [Sulfuracidifex tepidarius]|uniref:Uncharacterized protein n=1 Tax=Sulfuracidifex tepidarius TaxID=1294262 RepID=A0A510DWC6_9CREN|nr:ABC transporter substrate-binding protein [Sulfuracidifex tepidarius]BBG24300.1 hypothetical protein IC006_1610 [Sulfuracidifex tepidarius]BBG27057.1 hypothetical protein IC007_1587 [Sulfuracidifex tepidarius]